MAILLIKERVWGLLGEKTRNNIIGPLDKVLFEDELNAEKDSQRKKDKTGQN